jgi:hypothetical protein
MVDDQSLTVKKQRKRLSNPKKELSELTQFIVRRYYPHSDRAESRTTEARVLIGKQ